LGAGWVVAPWPSASPSYTCWALWWRGSSTGGGAPTSTPPTGVEVVGEFRARIANFHRDDTD
jgi:hypothetical protein